MSSISSALEARRTSLPVEARPEGSVRYDALMSALGAWIVGGLYLDGWAHGHGRVDDTFFTPWHAILYAGLFVYGAGLILTLLRNILRGYNWRRALPAGYPLALVGLPLFSVAGIVDLAWHELYGFEVGVEPLLSPPHLALALAGVLMIGGPLRAALGRRNAEQASTWTALLPALVSLTLTWSILTFFTEFVHPLASPWAERNRFGDIGHSLGAGSILLQTGLMMGVTLLLVRRWRLPLGALTLIYTLNMALMSVLNDQFRFIPAALLVGIVADMLIQFLQPSAERPASMRLFAFSVPVIFYGLYFVTIDQTSGIAWTVHLWLGALIMAGVTGLLLSYLVVPPGEQGT